MNMKLNSVLVVALIRSKAQYCKHRFDEIVQLEHHGTQKDPLDKDCTRALVGIAAVQDIRLLVVQWHQAGICRAFQDKMDPTSSIQTRNSIMKIANATCIRSL